MNRIFGGVGLGLAALAAVLTFATAASAAANGCVAAKNKCANGKMQGLLKCQNKADKTGIAVDPACVAKAKFKYDGVTGAGVLGKTPDATKGCFAKAEIKNDGPCLTTGDSKAFEAKVDAFVDDVVREVNPVNNPLSNSGPFIALANGPCSAGKEKCVLKKAAAILKAYGKAQKDGTTVDATALAKARFKYDGVTGAGLLGKTPDATKGCFAKLEAKGGCLTTNNTGALEDAVDNFVDDVLVELAQEATPMNTRRCTGDTRTGCSVNADCAVPGGTCEFWFGSNLPLSAGGVDTCVTNQFSGAVTGTANVDTGASAGTAALISRVYQGAAAGSPCPKCIGDAVANDGIRGGTCNAGAHSGATCDSNGISGQRSFGATSLDCPPSAGGIVAALPIDLSNTTGTKTRTLSASSPNCRAVGFTTDKCFCDTCGGGTNPGAPCASSSDCTGGGVCGGKRCLGTGGNVGTSCTVNGDCTSSGGCGVPGTATQPNQCDDATCSAIPGNSGECAAGPTDFLCGPQGRTTGCSVNADCAAIAGDTCSIVRQRPCFTDNGSSGNSVTAVGFQSTPVDHESDPILANEFCIGPTTSTSVNNAAGLPGLGRVPIRGHSTDNGTSGACPTTITFDPDTGTHGVLDSGWTGLSHHAPLVGKGLVTVSVTSCANATPPCGQCNYTGPIPNVGAAPVP